MGHADDVLESSGALVLEVSATALEWASDSWCGSGNKLTTLPIDLARLTSIKSVKVNLMLHCTTPHATLLHPSCYIADWGIGWGQVSSNRLRTVPRELLDAGDDGLIVLDLENNPLVRLPYMLLLMVMGCAGSRNGQQRVGIGGSRAGSRCGS